MIDVFFKMLKKLLETHFRGLITSIIVKSGSKKERLSVLSNGFFSQLVDTSKTFFSFDAILNFVEFSFLKPWLKLFVILPQIMGSNLVVQDSKHSSFPVLYGEPYIELAFASFSVMGD